MTANKRTDTNIPWFARPDDLIGGWCIMTIDKTPGDITREDLEAGHGSVGDFLTEEIAKYIVDLHMKRLTGQ